MRGPCVPPPENLDLSVIIVAFGIILISMNLLMFPSTNGDFCLGGVLVGVVILLYEINKSIPRDKE